MDKNQLENPKNVQNLTPVPPRNHLRFFSPEGRKLYFSREILSNKILVVAVIIIVVLAGIFSGLVLSSRAISPRSQANASIDEESLSKEQKESFTQTFRDEAEGVIEANDALDKYAQGTHKLIRPGGENQTAYLTSSVLDLDQYEGEKVKVFGETFGSSQVGWLMDVGKVEVIK